MTTLWPRGLVLQDREDRADRCGCPDCPHQWFPCCVPCFGYPVYFATESNDETPTVSAESRIRYPFFYCPGWCNAWEIERADVNGVPMKFVGRDCENGCMPGINIYDWSKMEDNQPSFVGSVAMNCGCCNFCGESAVSVAYDKNKNIVLRRYATFCCCRAANFNDLGKNCCSCWKQYNWNVKDHDEHFRGKIFERYHTLTCCHPYQWGYSAASLRGMNLSEEHQKLLPGFLLAMFWRGEMVREQEDDIVVN
jgi:hypothetical protein